jgi:CheY-like chemotaxis protein
MRALAGHRVLIVENELLVALDIADALKGAGAEVVVSRTVGDALSQAETQSLTAAVIDHILYDGITTSDVCAKLKERKIPFIVYSGFSKLEGACADGELVHKPATPHRCSRPCKAYSPGKAMEPPHGPDEGSEGPGRRNVRRLLS